MQSAELIYIKEARRILSLAPPEGAKWHHRVVGRLQDEASLMVGAAREAELERRRLRHRAGPDAEGMRWIFHYVLRRADERLRDFPAE